MKLILLFIVLVLIQVKCKKFTMCKLAKELYDFKPLTNTFLPSYICIVELVNRERDTSLVNGSSKKYYGLYQLGSDVCGDSRSSGLCNIKCESLLSENVDASTSCALKVVDQKGFNYWEGYRSKCADRLAEYSSKIYSCPEIKFARP